MSNIESIEKLLNDIGNEFLERKRLGESPQVTEYCERNAEHAEEIRDFLKTLDLLNNVPAGKQTDAENCASSSTPPTIAGYKIEGEIGRGGMGIVYEAIQKSLNRRVALKILPQHWMQDKKSYERFQREAQAAAMMHHTNIVPVFDVGDDDEHLFYVMQLIPGRSLHEVIAEFQKSGTNPSSASLSDSGRSSSSISITKSKCHDHHRWGARVGIQVAEALEYAHGRQIVHRDIKPSNVLIDESDIAWVTDFGVAKVAETDLTNPGDLVGTLRYMSPERFQGDCDNRSDVYSLGLTLYELLALKPAFISTDRLKLIDEIKNTSPPFIRSIDSRIPRDLETIVLKAIEKEPRNRYQSAQQLADDLRRFLSDRPISARRITPLEQLVRLTRRNKGIAASIATILLLLLALTAGSIYSAVHFRSQESHQKLLTSQLRRKLYAFQIQRADSAYRDDNIDVARMCIDECPEELRGWEWSRNHWLVRPRSIRSIDGFERPAFTPDGQFLVSGGHRSTGDQAAAKIWNLANGRNVNEKMAGQNFLTSLVMSDDGKHLATGHLDGKVILWDFESQMARWSIQAHTAKIDGLDFNPEGTQIASVSWDQTLKLIDVNSGTIDATIGPVGYRLRCVEYSHSGEDVAAACFQGGAEATGKVWNVASGQLKLDLRGHQDSTETIAFSHDDRHVLTGSRDKTIKLWDSEDGEVQSTFSGHLGQVASVAFSPDGLYFASGSSDRTLRIWEIDTGNEVTRYRTGKSVAWITYDKDGEKIATFGDGKIDVWNAIGPADTMFLNHGPGVRDCKLSPDGQQIASCGDAGLIKIWDVETGMLKQVLQGHEAEVEALSWHPNRSRIASASADQTVRIWDTISGRSLKCLPIPGHRLAGIEFSPDGSKLLSISLGRTAFMIDSSSLDLIEKFEFEHAVRSIAWSLDGRFFASGHSKNATLLWDATTRSVVKTLPLGEFGVTFTPDGTNIVAGRNDGTIWIGNTTGETVRYLGEHQGRIASLAISPNEQRLISAGVQDSTVKIWDLSSGEELLGLRGHEDGLRSVFVSNDGSVIVSGSRDGTVGIWESDGSDISWRTRQNVNSASSRVDRLFDSHTFCEGVLKHLTENDTDHSEFNELMIKTATIRSDNAFKNFEKAWSVILSEKTSKESYELARRHAEVACSIVPDSGVFRTALGIAEFRVGHLKSALQELQRAQKKLTIKTPTNTQPGLYHKATFPVNVGFVALTLFELDRLEDAKNELIRLREILQNPLWKDYAETEIILDEANRRIR